MKRALSLVLLAVGVACVGWSTWTIWHGGSILQFVLLGLSGLLVANLGGRLWEDGGKR